MGLESEKYIPAIDAILAVSDLAVISSKRIRINLEERLKIDLTPFKAEVDAIIIERFIVAQEKQENEASAKSTSIVDSPPPLPTPPSPSQRKRQHHPDPLPDSPVASRRKLSPPDSTLNSQPSSRVKYPSSTTLTTLNTPPPLTVSHVTTLNSTLNSTVAPETSATSPDQSINPTIPSFEKIDFPTTASQGTLSGLITLKKFNQAVGVLYFCQQVHTFFLLNKNLFTKKTAVQYLLATGFNPDTLSVVNHHLPQPESYLEILNYLFTRYGKSLPAQSTHAKFKLTLPASSKASAIIDFMNRLAELFPDTLYSDKQAMEHAIDSIPSHYINHYGPLINYTSFPNFCHDFVSSLNLSLSQSSRKSNIHDLFPNYRSDGNSNKGIKCYNCNSGKHHGYNCPRPSKNQLLSLGPSNSHHSKRTHIPFNGNIICYNCKGKHHVNLCPRLSKTQLVEFLNQRSNSSNQRPASDLLKRNLPRSW